MSEACDGVGVTTLAAAGSSYDDSSLASCSVRSRVKALV